MPNRSYAERYVSPTYIIDTPSTQITRHLLTRKGIAFASAKLEQYNAMPLWKRILHRNDYNKVLGMLAVLEVMQRWSIGDEMQGDG